jgi:hypothetical protein
MDVRTTRRLEMGARALEFSQAHPDESAGYNSVIAELKELLERSKQLADQQRQRTAVARAATARKRALRRSLRQGELTFLARAARRAAKEVPELAQKFALSRQHLPYLAFRSLARTLLAEGQARKELLVRYGLSDRVLDTLAQRLDEFDQSLSEGTEGRRMSVEARVELQVKGDELIKVVGVIDGLNRIRFADDPDLLAAWRSASNVIGPRRIGGKAVGRIEQPSQTPLSGGEIKPAA